MKKSSILIALGPVIAEGGIVFLRPILRFLFSNSVETSSLYYAISNGLNFAMLIIGLVLFIVGWVFFFKEKKSTTELPRKTLNNWLMTLGTMGALIILLQIVATILIDASFRG